MPESAARFKRLSRHATIVGKTARALKTLLDDVREANHDKQKRFDSASEECVLCFMPVGPYGNSACPLAEGRCCDACNVRVVLERMRYLNPRAVPLHSSRDP